MRALLMSLSSWCATVPGVGVSPPATCTLSRKRHRTEKSLLSALSSFTPTLSHLRLPSKAKRIHASLTHPWSWSLLTILRCHQARSASLSSSAEHVSICSHRTHLWSSQRSLACSAPGFSCDPSWPWWNSGFGLQLHALSSSPLLLCTRKYTMLITNRQTQSHFTESGQQDQRHELPSTWWLLLLTFTVRNTPPFQHTHKRIWATWRWEVIMGCPDSSITWDQVALLTTRLSSIPLQLRKTQKWGSYL